MMASGVFAPAFVVSAVTPTPAAMAANQPVALAAAPEARDVALEDWDAWSPLAAARRRRVVLNWL